uniref:Uncharacterized protein n=1 Tax=Tanacetum cinerariifolium TaxID=118510 RepID=A0A6L2JRK5_TANCI|nr:hypothetical protein [Tanacetum cinerariifolium]
MIKIIYIHSLFVRSKKNETSLCYEGEPKRLWLDEEENDGGWIRMNTAMETIRRISQLLNMLMFSALMG